MDRNKLVEGETTIRYVKVRMPEYDPWYIDESDTAEIGDIVLAPFTGLELKGVVKQVVRCIYPHVVFEVRKTKSIIEIVEDKPREN